MKDTEFFLTIIIPMYNVKPVVAPLLRQLRMLDDADIEFLFIDDGSTDGSRQYVQSLLTDVRHVRVVANADHGVSQSRNLGIRIAKGEYTWFIDADDQIRLPLVKAVLAKLQTARPDIIQFGYEEFRQGDALAQPATARVQWRAVTGVELFDQLAHNQIQHYPWAHIVRRKLYQQVPVVFPEDRIFEDMATTYKLFLAAASALQTQSPVYLYQVRPDSASNTHSQREVADAVTVADEFRHELLQKQQSAQASLLTERAYLMAYGDSLRFKSASWGRRCATAIRHIYLTTRWRHHGIAMVKTRIRQLLMISGLYPFLTERRNL